MALEEKVRLLRRLPEDAIDHRTEIVETKLGLTARQIYSAKSWGTVKFITGSTGVTFATRQSGAEAGSGTPLAPDVLFDAGLVSPGTEFYAAGPAGSTVDVISTPLPWLNRLVKVIMDPVLFNGIVESLKPKPPKRLVIRVPANRVSAKSMRKAG